MIQGPAAVAVGEGPTERADRPAHALSGGPGKAAQGGGEEPQGDVEQSRLQPGSETALLPPRHPLPVRQQVGDGLVPVAAGAEDQLAHLAHHGAASRAAEDAVYAIAHLQCRVRGSEGEARAAQDGQIEYVLPYVTHPVCRST